MNILLLGDFSSAHYNLKRALELIGHSVTLYSNGDKYKNIPSDKKFYIRKPGENSLLGASKEILSHLKITPEINKYDIIQLISHRVFHNRINNFLVNHILNTGKPVVLFNAACNYPYNQFVKTLDYSPCNECKKYDLKSDTCIHETKKEINTEKKLYTKFNAIVSAHFEYYESFNHSLFRSKNYFIPIPIFTKNELTLPEIPDVLNVYFGQTRRGFKGVDVILDAINEIKNSVHSKFFKFTINKQLPYHEHVKTLNQAHVLIDQVNSYSYGVNTLVGLSKGKIVLSGMEPDVLKWMNIPANENPIINIKPNKQDIIDKLLYLHENKHQLSELSIKGIEFVKKYHAPISIAQQYESLYKKLI